MIQIETQTEIWGEVVDSAALHPPCALVNKQALLQQKRVSAGRTAIARPGAPKQSPRSATFFGHSTLCPYVSRQTRNVLGRVAPIELPV